MSVVMPWDAPYVAEAGKIKIGKLGNWTRSRNGKEYRAPIKLDHFVLLTNHRDERGDLIPDRYLMESLEGWQDDDGRLRSLPIVLLSDDLDEVFPSNLAWYSGRTLVCRGDGEIATRHEVKEGRKTGRTKNVNCPCEFSSLVTEQGRCKPHATLHCSIRSPGRSVAGAVHLWRTTSVISIRRMRGSLNQIRSLVGSLAGVPLTLVLSKVQLEARAPVYCCHLELRELDLLNAQRHVLDMARHRQAVSAAVKGERLHLRMLPPGGEHETEQEQAEVAAEFHPPVSIVEGEADEDHPGEVTEDWPGGGIPLDDGPENGRSTILDGLDAKPCEHDWLEWRGHNSDLPPRLRCVSCGAYKDEHNPT